MAENGTGYRQVNWTDTDSFSAVSFPLLAALPSLSLLRRFAMKEPQTL